MKIVSSIILILVSIQMVGQQSLRLDQCYALVEKNYPLVKQKSLINQQGNTEVDILKTKKKPQLGFEAQATYQSDVIELPIQLPNISINSPNKDQYKATMNVSQIIYDGGLVNASVKAKEAATKTQLKNIEVNLYSLKKQINEIYFSVLLIQEKKALLDAKKSQLYARLNEVQAGIRYGTLLPTSDNVLEAELLKVTQQQTELKINKQSLLNVLSSLIGKDINQDITLETPMVSQIVNGTISRPEIDLFTLQKQQIDASEKVISKQNIPKLVGFVTGGYGNPGLNMLDNSFQPFYIVGAKLNWNVFDWNNSKKQQESLKINKELINNQEELFTLNTKIESDKYQSEINIYQTFIISDKEIITLREKVVKTTEAQLKNGVITASAYITELTNLFEAKSNLSSHTIQLLMAKINYNTTKGN